MDDIRLKLPIHCPSLIMVWDYTRNQIEGHVSMDTELRVVSFLGNFRLFSKSFLMTRAAVWFCLQLSCLCTRCESVNTNSTRTRRMLGAVNTQADRHMDPPSPSPSWCTHQMLSLHLPAGLRRLRHSSMTSAMLQQCSHKAVVRGEHGFGFGWHFSCYYYCWLMVCFLVFCFF